MAGLFVILVLIILVAYKQIISFYRGIHFQDHMGTTLRENDEIKTAEFVVIDVSTPRAFLPYEKTKFSARLKIIDEKLKKLADENEIHFTLLGTSAILTKGKINNKYKSKEEPKNNFGNLGHFTPKEVAYSVFKPTGEYEYFTELEVVFTKPEIVSPTIFYGTATFITTSLRIEIGSIVDVMNKRTNDLLYILTVAGFLLAIYSQFGNDLRAFFTKDKGEKPTCNSDNSPKKDTIGKVFKIFNK